MSFSASAADALAQLYPQSKVLHWEHPEQGMDHVVDVAHLSTGESLVVRRPLTQPYKDHAAIEERLLADLKKALRQSPLPVRLPTMIANNADFHIQSYVPGVPLDASRWNSLNLHERARTIDQLGEFFDALRSVHHSLETSWLVDSHPNRTDPRALPYKVALSYERAQECLFPLLSERESKGVEAIFDNVWNAIKGLALDELTLVHSDLYSTHLRFADSLGIIDFSDMNIGDPAVDLQHLGEISPELLNAVCTDEEMKLRARAYKQWDNIFLVVDYLRRDDLVSARALLSSTLRRQK